MLGWAFLVGIILGAMGFAIRHRLVFLVKLSFLVFWVFFLCTILTPFALVIWGKRHKLNFYAAKVR
jgi:hypothetical protein